MNTDNVCYGRNRLWRVHHLDTKFRGAFPRQTPAPRNDRHTKRPRTRNHLLTNLADSDQPHGAPTQPPALRKPFLVPTTCRHGNTLSSVRRFGAEISAEGDVAR